MYIRVLQTPRPSPNFPIFCQIVTNDANSKIANFFSIGLELKARWPSYNNFIARRRKEGSCNNIYYIFWRALLPVCVGFVLKYILLHTFLICLDSFMNTHVHDLC